MDRQNAVGHTDCLCPIPRHTHAIPGLFFVCFHVSWLVSGRLCPRVWRDLWRLSCSQMHVWVCVSPDPPPEMSVTDDTFLMFAIQTQMNVTIPSTANCTSPSLCWTDGLHTWTIKNMTQRENIAKCEWNSRRQPRGQAVWGADGWWPRRLRGDRRNELGWGEWGRK